LARSPTLDFPFLGGDDQPSLGRGKTPHRSGHIGPPNFLPRFGLVNMDRALIPHEEMLANPGDAMSPYALKFGFPDFPADGPAQRIVHVHPANPSRLDGE